MSSFESSDNSRPLRPVSAYSQWCSRHNLQPYADVASPGYKMAPPPDWYHEQVRERHTYDIAPPRPGSSYSLGSRASKSYDFSTFERGYRDQTLGGREEYLDDGDKNFDVRADFDGDGPRWSERYSPRKAADDSESYRPISSHLDLPTPSINDARSKEELVSVPVLGAEWQRGELHDMSRRGQSEVRKEKRTAAWRSWTRDQKGLCGARWLTRKTLVFVLFFFFVALAIILFITIPRAPSFTFYVTEPFTVNNGTIAFSRTPTNFSFAGNLNLFADSTPSYLPVHFSNIEATLYDLSTSEVIATGNYGNHVIPRQQNAPVVLPVEFSYSALNSSDPTWNNMYNACGHIWPGTNRTGLMLQLELRMSIIGLVTHPFSQTQISNVECPFELSSTSV